MFDETGGSRRTRKTSDEKDEKDEKRQASTMLQTMAS
jgi:hypothetical protein